MVFPKEDISVDLRRVLFEIAYALDAVGIDEIYHGHRVAYIAYRCAQKLNWSDEKAQFAYALGLIHDCGVSELKERQDLLSQLVPNNTSVHCIKGYELLKACRPLAAMATPILYHHTWWRDLAELNSVSRSDKQFASLIFLADRLDSFRANSDLDSYGNLTPQCKRDIAADLQANQGIMFETTQVSAMLELIECDDFWFSMEPRYIEALSDGFSHLPFFSVRIGLDESIEVAELFGKIVDAKSSFTYQHSLHVAQLAEFLGVQLGYSTHTTRMLYLAGLIHDIGKLNTPSRILHKPGKLTDEEYTCIKRHATDSRYVLQSMFANSKIIHWAANHHERLDGSGYPLGLLAKDLDEPSRLIAVMDVFQALTQSRPYRAGLSLEKAIAIIAELVEQDKLDAEVFACLVANAEECYRISTGQINVEPLLACNGSM